MLDALLANAITYPKLQGLWRRPGDDEAVGRLLTRHRLLIIIVLCALLWGGVWLLFVAAQALIGLF